MYNDLQVIEDISRVTGVKYSNEQIEILKHRGGMCILACAGSGKTTILTHLLLKRIKTGEISDTRKLLCTTYSKAGSMEMEERLGKLLGKLGMDNKIQVKTLHASYYMILKQFGLTSNVCGGAQRSSFISASCKENGVMLSDEDMQLLDSLLSYQINNLLSDEALMKSYVYTLEDLPLDKYSAIRLSYNKKKEEAGVIDFDDMQLYMYMMLVREKRQDVVQFCRNLWTDFFVDEFQDVSKIQFAILRELVTDPNKLVVIGDDDQCLVEGTLVETARGKLPIEQIEVGDMVTSGIGGGKVFNLMIDNVSKKKVSENIVVIKTKNGREIRGTTNHVGFARLVPNENYHYTYLMYNKEIGFRIGTTSGVRSSSRGEIRNGIDMRLMQERSDKAWLIKKCSNKEEALYWESYYAYKYGIPMYRFVDNSSGSAKTALTRDAIVNLHKQLDTFNKGIELLKDLEMYFEYPHRVPQAEGSRNKINFSMFSSCQTDKYGIHKNEISANSSNQDYVGILRNYLSTIVRKASNSNYTYYNSRSTNNDTDMQEDIINNVVRECRQRGIYIDINKDAKFNDNKYMFMPFGNMIEGMFIPVLNGGTIEEDEIVNITREKYEGYVYDISVPAARNFIANDIVVHNCIYQWRGADPNIILNICGYYDIKPFVLSTNYRCGGEIVKHAAVGITNNEKRAMKTMVPHNQGGRIRICDIGNGDLYSMSKIAFKHIKDTLAKGEFGIGDIAMLSRNNQHLCIVNNMLFKEGIYTNTAEEMRMTKTSMYKDLKNVIEIANDTYNHNLVASTLWRCCPYLGTKGAKMISNLMDASGCCLKDALGYTLNNYGRTSARVDWKGRLRIPQKAEDKLEYEYLSVKEDTEYGLVAIYNILCEKDEVVKVTGMFEQYILGSSFMYKTMDRIRSLTGLVNYIKSLIAEKGLADTKSFLRLTEQYESGHMEVPGQKITMCTMHGSKGREWPHVILFADDNITFPSFEGIAKMVQDRIELKDISGGIDENRRLHYVAMTRAKKDLTIFTDRNNVSVYTLEALGILNKNGIPYNKHIISMANYGNVSMDLIQMAEQRVFTEGSPYYYKLTVEEGANNQDQVEQQKLFEEQ